MMPEPAIIAVLFVIYKLSFTLDLIASIKNKITPMRKTRTGALVDHISIRKLN